MPPPICASAHLRPICGPSAAHLRICASAAHLRPIGGTIPHLGHICYHCKQPVGTGEVHDCWTTTEAALTAALSEELREAWERLRETAADFGEQRIYASHHSIMFSRRSCYFFVRPKQTFLELNVFLGRAITAPQIRKVVASSATKRVHVIRVQHRDEVEAPITDWLREAYDFAGEDPKAQKVKRAAAAGTHGSAKRAGKKTAPRKASPATAARQPATASGWKRPRSTAPEPPAPTTTQRRSRTLPPRKRSR